MKKKSLFIFVLSIALLISLAACSKPEETKVTVSFDSNGGSTVSSIVVKSGDRISKPDNPSKYGYIFSKWTLNGKEFDFTNAILKDITLVAEWEVDTTEYASSITFEHPNMWMQIYTSFQLEPIVYPEQSISTLKFESSDPSIVSIDNEGNITAHRSGRVTITVSSGNTVATMGMEVRVPGEGIEFNKKAITLSYNGENDVYTDLYATLIPDNTQNKGIYYSSEDESICTIDEQGVVTSVFLGQTKVIAENDYGHKAECTVYVDGIAFIVSADKTELTYGESTEFTPYELKYYQGLSSYTAIDLDDISISGSRYIKLVDGKLKLDLKPAKETKESVAIKWVSKDITQIVEFTIKP